MKWSHGFILGMETLDAKYNLAYINSILCGYMYVPTVQTFLMAPQLYIPLRRFLFQSGCKFTLLKKKRFVVSLITSCQSPTQADLNTLLEYYPQYEARIIMMMMSQLPSLSDQLTDFHIAACRQTTIDIPGNPLDMTQQQHKYYMHKQIQHQQYTFY